MTQTPYAAIAGGEAEQVAGRHVRLLADEFEVTLTEREYRSRAPGRRAAAVGTEIAGRGFGVMRSAASFGKRMLTAKAGPLAALEAGPVGRTAATAVSAVAPVIGLDRLRRFLAPDPGAMSLCVDGQAIRADPEALAAAYPHPTSRLLVLVHGSGESEQAWRRHEAQLGGSYATRLAGRSGWTPVVLRYDGRGNLTENGVALSALLQEVVDGWPVDVGRVALLGHGAGGLVLRAACGVRAFSRSPWTDLVSEVVCLGTPHLANPNANRHRAGGPFAGLPEASAVARRLDEKLAGLTAADRAQRDVPALPHARYVIISDEVTVSRNAVGGALGGVMWWRQTAVGRSKQAVDLFPTAERYEVSTREHPLVNHPEVDDALREWLR